MWLIVPLVFVLSWRTCRRLGQAVNETAAWIFGYLVTAGLIWVSDVGGIDVVAAKPIGPGAVIAYGGGFVGMLVSRYRWKRRGGHLQPADDRLSRAIRAVFSKPGAASGPSSSPRTAPVSSSDAGPASSPKPADVASRPAELSLGRALGQAVRAAGTPPGGKPNRWVRALAAMLDDSSSRSERR